ncbi:type VII secretion target [Mycolicibacterium sp.]|uniref:type VII secretion target n=1 Tax=Mycolicibacterium sp. TaxID=2320850 RepID=UPI001A347D5F|nr:type VII secretion target [Mycolicibacterium sp.]MBJ7340756.1 ESX-1 secretion-associated protein [Mycolicibacterium sp.]
MGNEFSLDGAGLTPLADIHSQVAIGLSQLTGAGAPQTADVAQSFGNIAFAVNTALDGATQSRASTISTTKGSSDTIAELLTKAHQMYEHGDQQGAQKLRAAAEALEGSGAVGGTGDGGTAAGGTGAAGAEGAGGSGAQLAGQMASQIGQQVGQFAQGMAQSAQGLAQGLAQLPQQVMQGVQGIVESASKGAGAETATIDAAKGDDGKGGDPEERAREDDEAAEKRAEEQRHGPATRTDGAQPGQSPDGERAPVAPPAPERQPAQTRPQ